MRKSPQINLSMFEQKFLLGGWKGYVIGEWGSYACARVTPGCIKERIKLPVRK